MHDHDPVAPGHDHARCCAETLARAEDICARRAQRLTPIRRQVLEVVAAGHEPVGAYQIIDALALKGPRPAPITVYRALDFLTHQGLVHRVESRNAYVACSHRHGDDEAVLMLICDACGTVREVPCPSLADAIVQVAGGAGFVPRLPVIEVGGTCAHCLDRAEG